MGTNRLLLICQHYYPEMVSTGLHMTELSTSLQQAFEKEYEIEVLCSYPSIKGFENENIKNEYKGVRIKRIPHLGKQHGGILSRLFFSLSFMLGVFRYLITHQKKYKGFIITTNPPFLGLITLIIKKIFQKPYFLIVYDVYPEIAVKLEVLKENSIITKFWSWASKLILLGADQFSVIGRDMESLILAKSPKLKRKSNLIANWADSAEMKKISPLENKFLQQNPELLNKTLLTYSGNMGRTHNVEDILKIADCLRSYDDIVFLIIGGGAKFEKMRDLSESFNNVIVMPYQPFEMVPHVLNASKASIVCLDDEFMGYSVPSKTYSILAVAKPVIALLNAKSEIGLVINEAKCGLVFSDGFTPSSAANTIVDSLKNGQFELWGNNARNEFFNNYTLDIATAKYKKSIMKMFNGKK